MNKIKVVVGALVLAVVGCQSAIDSTESAIANWKDTRCELKLLKSSVNDPDVAKTLETLDIVPFGIYKGVVALVDQIAPDEKVRAEFAYFAKCLKEAAADKRVLDEKLIKEITAKVNDKFGPDAMKRIAKYAADVKKKNADGTFAKLQAEAASLNEKIAAATKDVMERKNAIIASVQKLKGNPLYVAGQVAKATKDLDVILSQLKDASKGLALATALITLEIADAGAKVTMKVGEGMLKGGKLIINGVAITCEAVGDAVAIPLTDLAIAMADTGDGVTEG